MINTPHVKSRIWLYKVCFLRIVPWSSADTALSLKVASSASVSAWTSAPFDPRHWRGALQDFQLMMATVHSSPVIFFSELTLKRDQACSAVQHRTMKRWWCPSISSPARRKKPLLAFTLEFSNQLVGLQDRLDCRFGHFWQQQADIGLEVGSSLCCFPRQCSNGTAQLWQLVRVQRSLCLALSLPRHLDLINPLGDIGLLWNTQTHVRRLRNFTSSKFNILILPFAPVVSFLKFMSFMFSLNEKKCL